MTFFPSTSTILSYLATSFLPLGSSWGHPGTLLDPLGVILGPSWAILGPPWALLGPPWGHLGAILAQLGAILGHLGASLAPPWATLAPSWAMTCSSWANLVPLGALLEPSGRLPGPCWAHLGNIWGPFWGHLGIILRYVGLTFASLSSFLTYRSILAPLAYLSPKKHLASRSQALEVPRRGREALTISIRTLYVCVIIILYA